MNMRKWLMGFFGILVFGGCAVQNTYKVGDASSNTSEKCSQRQDGNSLTVSNLADMAIHLSFTAGGKGYETDVRVGETAFFSISSPTNPFVVTASAVTKYHRYDRNTGERYDLTNNYGDTIKVTLKGCNGAHGFIKVLTYRPEAFAGLPYNIYLNGQ